MKDNNSACPACLATKECPHCGKEIYVWFINEHQRCANPECKKPILSSKQKAKYRV